MGKIVHGNKNFYYAPITEGAFGTPVAIPGMVSATIEVEQETTNVYADNKVWTTTKGAKVRTAEVAFRNIPESYLPYLGFVAAANGGYSDTGTFAKHCIMFQTTEEDDGVTTPTLHCLYAVTAGEPNVEVQTDEDSVEAAEITVNYAATDSDFVVDAQGNACQYFKITRNETNKTLFDQFATQVILPTTTN